MRADRCIYDNTGNNWSHRNSNKMLTKNLVTIPRKLSIHSLQKNITHNSENAAY